MPSHGQLIDQAEELGREAGNAAASWYYDRCEPSRADFLRVLKGIRECDPEIMDTFVSGSLSGEYADDMTPMKLYELLGIETQTTLNAIGDTVCDAWERGFNTAYQRAVESATIEYLRTTYVFHIELELIEQDPQKVLSAMCDKAAEMNCSLVEEHVSEDGEIIEA